jgi:predicted transcriptional regulator
MPRSDNNLDKSIGFSTTKNSSIIDLLFLKDEFSQRIRKHILSSNSNFTNFKTLLEDLKSVNEVFEVKENLSNGNVPVSQPLGIITDNIFNENNKGENKIEKIMRKLEEYYLLPVESQSFQDVPMDGKEDEPPVLKITDRLVIPESLKVTDGFNLKRKEQILLDQFPMVDDKDPEQQTTVILKFIVQKIHEFKSKANAVHCEYGKEIPTPYGKLLCYVLNFFNYLPTLPCIIQMASFTIFKDLPVYFEKALLPHRWLLVAPTSSRALKESVLDLQPIYYFPGGTKHLDGFKSGLVVYFYNQDFELEELLRYRWDCTMIFGEAKEKKPSDKAFDLLTIMEKYQKERLGFLILCFETSENLWSKVVTIEEIGRA